VNPVEHPPPPYRIETERLTIRCWQPRDAPLLGDAIDSSLDHLRPWMPWAHEEPRSLDERLELLRGFRGRFDLGEDFVYGIFASDESEVIGGSGLHRRVGSGALEIGYWIRASQVGRGLARETTAALAKAAFQVCGVDRVEIHVDPGERAEPAHSSRARLHGGGDAEAAPTVDGGGAAAGLGRLRPVRRRARRVACRPRRARRVRRSRPQDRALALRYNPPPMSSDRVTLEVSERAADQVGSRRARRLRKEGLVPGVLYGKGSTRAIAVGERELRAALTGPSGIHAIVDVVVEGQTTPHHAVLKDFQRHPIRGTITHVDFHEVRLDRPIQATVAVQLVGESPGSKQGGIVQQVTREIQVEALPTGIPEHIEADISSLEVGGTIRVEDLPSLEGVTYLDDPQVVLANCSIPRGITELEEAEAAEGEEGEELAEGEVAADASDEGAESESE
jgi:ribosomal protein bL25 (Ctc-form)